MSDTLASNDSLTGQLISGRYRVIRPLGEGGMGKVYLAEHEAIEKKIALKVLHREYSANPEVVERFKQEAISASRIKHPNVIDVFDFGQLDDGSCFIAMELLEGQDLGDALQKVGAFDPEQAIRIALQICRALGTAHSRGVVHRDMKPENVFLQNTPEGEQIVKIVDFGIAQLRKGDEAEGAPERKRRLTKTGMIFGTPEYMAPEQARGLAIDQRSDVYATGVILYELLSGAVPFTGPSFLEVLNHHVLSPVPPLRTQNPEVEVSTELEIVVMRSLAKSPADRYASMKELAEALVETPEGRRIGRSISSISALGELSSSNAGRATLNGRGTEMHGSPRGTTPVVASQTVAEFEVPKSSFKGVWVWGGGAGVLAAALAVVFWVKGGSSVEEPGVPGGEPTGADRGATTEPGASSPTTPEPSAPSGQAAPSQSAAPQAPSAPAAPTQVVLHVTTTPTGAVVSKNGFQVCDASPCDVVVAPGEAVSLVAQLGNKTATAKVLAQQEQNVSMVLTGAAPTVKPKPPSGSTSSSSQQFCEVEVEGLKILRPCK